MSIDFSLTPDQKKLQGVARAFAEDVLKPVVQKADLEPDPQKAFQMMKGPYKKAYELGFAMGFLPKEYGGGSVSNVDLQIKKSLPLIRGLQPFCWSMAWVSCPSSGTAARSKNGNGSAPRPATRSKSIWQGGL